VNGNTTLPLSPAPAATEPQAPALPSRAPLSLHIDRLVLDGLPVGGAERGQLQAAMVAELESLLASGALGAELRGPVRCSGCAWTTSACTRCRRRADRPTDRLALHRGIGS